MDKGPDNEMGVKLADFGFAAFIDDHLEYDKQLSTAHYIAPEILQSRRITSKADIWSAGVIIYYLIYNKLPFEGRSSQEIFSNILN